MSRPAHVKTHSVTARPAAAIARAVIVAALLVTFGSAVTGCGQRGPLYYPDKDNPDRRR